MNKKYLHHQLTHLEAIKVRYLLVPFLIASTVSVVALRANNLHMIQLRNAVYAADKANSNVEGTLQNLRSYVYSHMNTNLDTGDNVYPPIQLKYTYQRLEQAAQAQAQAANVQVYTDAENYCQQQLPTGFSGRTRVPCVESYVTSHTVTAPTIPSAMYKFDFASPTWSPDLAGYSLIISVLLGVMVVLRLVGVRVLRYLTK